MERYQVWVSATATVSDHPHTDEYDAAPFTSEVEFMLTAVKDIQLARDTCSHMLDYPAIESAWIIRTKDGEVVQPHEKF